MPTTLFNAMLTENLLHMYYIKGFNLIKLGFHFGGCTRIEGDEDWSEGVKIQIYHGNLNGKDSDM